MTGEILQENEKMQLQQHFSDQDVYEGYQRKGQTLAVAINSEVTYNKVQLCC